MIKKAKLEGIIYDVITKEDFDRNPSVYSGYNNTVAIEKDGAIYPIRNMTDQRPGFYPSENKFLEPRNDLEKDIYYNAVIIDFSQAENFKELIQAQDKLNQAERSILTTPDSITIPIIGANDTPFLRAIKQAILDKKIDLDKYGPRFGSNYPNEKRLLKKGDMTLQKGILYAECLDFDIYVTIKDTDPDVPNPIGETITVKLTGDTGIVDEAPQEQEEEAACPMYFYTPSYGVPIITQNSEPNTFCPMTFY